MGKQISRVSENFEEILRKSLYNLKMDIYRNFAFIEKFRQMPIFFDRKQFKYTENAVWKSLKSESRRIFCEVGTRGGKLSLRGVILEGRREEREKLFYKERGRVLFAFVIQIIAAQPDSTLVGEFD